MRSITVKAALGGRERSFALPIGQLSELYDLVGVGPLRLYQQLQPLASDLAQTPEQARAIWAANPHAGDFPPTAVREILRLGLIGAEMAPPEAALVVERYVDGRPLLETLMLAFAVLGKALLPDPEADAPKKSPETPPEPTPEPTTSTSD